MAIAIFFLAGVALVSGCSSADDVAIVDAGAVTPGSDMPSLGKVDFQTDPSHSASTQFIPGSDAQVELTDASGSDWKLTIPSDALDDPETITITALSNIRSADIGGTFSGGVLMEPDGLQFLSPATLTVSGPGSQGNSVLLTGAQDGSSIQPSIPVDGQPRGAAAQIFHFSIQVVNDSSDDAAFKQMETRISDEYKEVVSYANDVLKKPIEVEEPPSMPLQCDDVPGSQPNRWVQDYVKAASNPEQTAIESLLYSKHDAQVVGMENMATYSDLETKLLNREIKKVQELMRTSNGKPEKVMAISAFAMSVSKEMQLLGVTGDQEFLTQVGDWAGSSVKPMLDDLVKNHDYTELQPLLKVAKMAQLLGNKSPSVTNIINETEAAMRFDLSLTYDVNYGARRLEESKFPVTMHYDEVARKQQFDGSGPVKYTYSNPFVPGETVKASPSTVNARIDAFDACKGTVTISIDRFYPDSEVTVYKGDSTPINFMQELWHKQNDSRLVSGRYSFEFKLNNGREYAVDENIQGGRNELASQFKVQLIHKPANG